MNVGIARLFQERAHDLGAFENIAPASRLQQRDDVEEIVLGVEAKLSVSFVQSTRCLACARTASHTAPFESQFS